MVGECKCRANKLTIVIERSGKYVVRGGRIKDKKIIHARVCSIKLMHTLDIAVTVVMNPLVEGIHVCIHNYTLVSNYKYLYS